MVIQMISWVKKRGIWKSCFPKIADFYDQEVDTAVKAMTSLIEPVIICVMGVVIGSIVICMFLPIFQMSLPGGQALRPCIVTGSRSRIILFGILALGLALRLLFLSLPFRGDEVFFFTNFVRQPMEAIVRLYHNTNNHLLYT